LGLVEEVIQLYFSQGMKQSEIADKLKEQGYQVSRGSVQRAIKSHSKRLKELKKNQDWAEALISATNKTPRLSIADAGLQIAAMKLLEEVSEIGTEDFGEMNTEKKIALLAKVSRAIGLAANVELNFERGRKQGIIESKDKLETAGKELGIPDDKIAALKAQVFGIGTSNANESV
jgi:transcriptional regulator with XRE-family HTH domain